MTVLGTVDDYFGSFDAHFNINSLLNDNDYYYYVSSHIDESNIDILTKPPRLNKGQIIDFYDNIRKKIKRNQLNIGLIKKYITIEPINNIINNWSFLGTITSKETSSSCHFFDF